jgi:type IV secretory pathway TrbL component
MFITFRFALITPIKSRFRMAPDTIAVAMNFLSGVLVLVFGTGLIKEVIGYFAPKNDEEETITTLGMYSGWMMLLFWLTSGMGAFLVFVDNKTDLGVMALTILAILSGFIFLRYVSTTREHGLKLHWDSLKYIIIS